MLLMYSVLEPKQIWVTFLLQDSFTAAHRDNNCYTALGVAIGDSHVEGDVDGL